MSQIGISCIGSAAIFTNTPDIFSGGNVDTVKFDFNDEWDAFTVKSAVFYTDPKTTSVQLLDENNVATIPSEMLAQKGKLSIGVIGTNTNDEVKTSRILTYVVGKGAVTNEMETTSCTPDIWLQLLTIVKHNQAVVDAMDLTVDESQMPNKANKDLSNVTNTVIESKGIARIAVGTYVGTGTRGGSQDTPMSLTFDFVPKVVFVSRGMAQSLDTTAFMWVNGMPTGGDLGYGGSSSSILWSNNLYFTLTDKTLSWYGNGSRVQKFDDNGVKHFYFALC